MGLPDLFMPMLRPIPRVGVVVEDELCKRAGTTLDREEFSVFELPHADQAVDVIQCRTKKGAMVILTSDSTPGLEQIVAEFLASNRDRVFKLIVITSNPGTYGEGIEKITPQNALDGSLAQAIQRIDNEKGGDRSIRPLF